MELLLLSIQNLKLNRVIRQGLIQSRQNKNGRSFNLPHISLIDSQK